jgi:hypothetical protein
MSQIEYLLPLVSIIAGLGLADLAKSVRELIRPNRTVRWHWLPLLWSAFTFLFVLQVWWTSSNILRRDAFADVLVFLPYLLVIVGLYLICAFALPDPGWSAERPASNGEDRDATVLSDTALDLKAFYFSVSHRQWFFGTLIAIGVLFEIISLSYFLIETDGGLVEFVRGRWDASVFLVGLAALMVSDRWWVHAVLSIMALGGAVSTLFFAPPIGG